MFERVRVVASLGGGAWQGTRRPGLPRGGPAAQALLVVALTLLLLGAAAPPPPALAAGHAPQELELFRLINEYREQQGLSRLLLSDPLSEAATRHSEDMGVYRFFSHISQASSYFPQGSTSSQRMALCGYAYSTYRGENLAAGYATASSVLSAWKGSPGHDALLRNPNFLVIGIGFKALQGSPYTYYWTTDFGGFVDSSAHDPFSPSTTLPPTSTTSVAASTSTTGTTTTTTTQPAPTTTLPPAATTTTSQATTSTTQATTTTTTVPQPSFVDVPEDHLFYKEIMNLAQRGVVQGYDGERFAPDEALRRAQFAKIIVLALGRHTAEVEAEEARFWDIPYDGESYPFDFVEEAAAHQLVQGFADGSFGPYLELSRVQVALMTARAGGSDLRRPPEGYHAPFKDVPDHAQEAVDLGYYNELLAGKSETVFDPYAPATRGQVAAITYRLLLRLGGL